jgi:hypothetical protein
LSQKIYKHCKSIFGNLEYFPVCIHVWLPVCAFRLVTLDGE